MLKARKVKKLWIQYLPPVCLFFRPQQSCFSCHSMSGFVYMLTVSAFLWSKEWGWTTLLPRGRRQRARAREIAEEDSARRRVAGTLALSGKNWLSGAARFSAEEEIELLYHETLLLESREIMKKYYPSTVQSAGLLSIQTRLKAYQANTAEYENISSATGLK